MTELEEQQHLEKLKDELQLIESYLKAKAIFQQKQQTIDNLQKRLNNKIATKAIELLSRQKKNATVIKNKNRRTGKS